MLFTCLREGGPGAVASATAGGVLEPPLSSSLSCGRMNMMNGNLYDDGGGGSGTGTTNGAGGGGTNGSGGGGSSSSGGSSATTPISSTTSPPYNHNNNTIKLESTSPIASSIPLSLSNGSSHSSPVGTSSTGPLHIPAKRPMGPAGGGTAAAAAAGASSCSLAYGGHTSAAAG